jgi:predicted lipid carrier protein YhbT
MRPAIATAPPLLSSLLRPLPLFPLQAPLSLLVRSLVRRHPQIFARLGQHAGKRIGLRPTDLPMAFVLDTSAGRPSAQVVRALPGGVDAAVSGPFAALVGLADGSFDGDALFFSRTIVVEGDVEAVLALRNALDDAGIDLVRDAAAVFGPFEGLAAAVLGRARTILAPGAGQARDVKQEGL